MKNPIRMQKDYKLPVWYLIDAQDQILGKIATKAAIILMGKNRSTYSYNSMSANFVIIINSRQVAITGNKNTQKVYKRYSAKPGATKTESFYHLKKRIPNRILEQAVKGMLPKSVLGKKMFSHLKVYAGDSHPHLAQQPIQLSI
uniref:Large ribosomal subunit protein uL13c n=1 Tax=Cyanidium caldarium TaxID=2771 RepID=Q9TLV3_CYACA|nr:ribosomal protein L13 [Cyanidium caldarium]AAF12929.1 unknown [Cyanidium caldarium]WDB00290.1 ribosomal protein L13 [Cyanidium caldarium]